MKAEMVEAVKAIQEAVNILERDGSFLWVPGWDREHEKKNRAPRYNKIRFAAQAVLAANRSYDEGTRASVSELATLIR